MSENRTSGETNDANNTDTTGNGSSGDGGNEDSTTGVGRDDENTKGFAEQTKLTSHFNKHNNEFNPPFANAQEYEQAAKNFLSGEPSSNVLQRVRPSGDIVRFNPTTNEFGIISKSGVIRTYFIPDPIKNGLSNLDYFLGGS